MSKDIQEASNEAYSLLFDKEMAQLIVKATEDPEAEEELNGHILEMKLITTNHDSETHRWALLLGTGGPAYRVVVTANFNGEVTDADFQFQDWFQPWTSATNQDKNLLIDFASACGLIYETLEQ